MKNPICLSTGSVYKFYSDFNDRIAKVREFDPDGVEVCFALASEVRDFVFSKSNLGYLQSLPFVSLHAPMQEIVYRDDEETRTILAKLETLARQVKAQNVVFHRDTIKNLDLLRDYSFVVSLENSDFRKNVMQTVAEVKAEFVQNPDFKFTFDFAHAYGLDPDSIPNFITELKDKIIEFHVAFLDKAIGDRPSYHWFLHKNDSEQVRSLLRHLDSPKTPIVIESTAAEEHEVDWLKQEIEYLRQI